MLYSPSVMDTYLDTWHSHGVGNIGRFLSRQVDVVRTRRYISTPRSATDAWDLKARRKGRQVNDS